MKTISIEFHNRYKNTVSNVIMARWPAAQLVNVTTAKTFTRVTISTTPSQLGTIIESLLYHNIPFTAKNQMA